MDAAEAKQAAIAFIDGCHIKSYVYDLRQVQNRASETTTTFNFRASFSRPSRVEPISKAVAYCTYYVSGTQN